MLEPLCGYLQLAERLSGDPELADAYNFGPESHELASVRSVVGLARQVYTQAEAELGVETSAPHEAGLLSLEVAKAKYVLGVAPRWGLAKRSRKP